MPLAGYKAASVFGYSSARVKAMESRLLSKEIMNSIINATDLGGIISILIQTDYRSNLEEFGGVKLKGEMIDFALSKNLAVNVGKLITITPPMYKDIIRAMVGKWDLYNIKLAVEAKERGMKFEDISRYVIDYGPYNAYNLQQLMNEPNTESILSKLAVSSPYKQIIAEALNSYKKSRDVSGVNMAIDRAYYIGMGSTITKLMDLHHESAMMIRYDIDMRNLIQLIKAKKFGLKFSEVSEQILPNGSLKERELEEMYESAKSIEEFIGSIKVFDLSKELEAYRKEKHKRLLAFEIGMRNQIFNSAAKLLRHSILSFGTIVAYSYMKEMEVLTLRVLVSSKIYALGSEETKGLISWS